MSDDRTKELAALKVALDVATLFRVIPWVFLLRDKRDPHALVRAALDESKQCIDAQLGDGQSDRHALMRGLTINLFSAMGVQFDPASINAIAGLVAQAVDGTLERQYDDGLTGEAG